MKREKLLIGGIIALILLGFLIMIYFVFLRSSSQEKKEVVLFSGTSHGITYKGFECDYNYVERGYYSLEDAYVVAAGERHVKGSKISILNIEVDAKKNVVVTVEESSSKEEKNPGVFVYPTVCFTLSEKPKSLRVVDSEGWRILLHH